MRRPNTLARIHDIEIAVDRLFERDELRGIDVLIFFLSVRGDYHEEIGAMIHTPEKVVTQRLKQIMTLVRRECRASA